MSIRTLALMALSLLAVTACRSTPLDRVWPGCTSCAPAPRVCPPAQPMGVAPELVAMPSGAVPYEIVIDERISPATDCNPIKTQHTLVVTVLDQAGNPMPGQRVEWMLGRSGDAVGDIVAHDDQYEVGVIAPLANARPTNAGNKVTNQLAVSITNYGPELLDAGNNYPYTSSDGSRLPDFSVGVGQSWVTITSAREGVTDIIAYVPAIRDGTQHKIFAKKIWADFDVEFPADAVNTLPEDTHALPVRVMRSDNTGIPGQDVEAEILDGPEAVFAGTNQRTARLTTNANGVVDLVLRNVGKTAGTNRIKLSALGNFYGETCPRTRIVTKRWQQVALEVDCSMPATAPVNVPFEKVITVTNTGDAPADNVELSDTPASGLTFADAPGFPMSLGSIPAGETITRTVRLVSARAAEYTNTVSVRSGAASAQSSCSIEIVEGRLEITKVCDPASTQAGSSVNFIVTVSNTGRGPLQNVTVVDEYPDGITPASQNSTSLGTLAPGESQEVIFAGVADAPGKYTNTARATADGVPEATATCALEVVQCSLKMAMVGPENIYYGEPADFTLNVQNDGTGDATGCTVRITYGGCLGGGFEDFQIGPLAPNEKWSKDWTRLAQSVGPCTITADSNCGASCNISDTATINVSGLAALQVEMTDKSIDGSEGGLFAVGETFLYRLRVENDGGTESTPEMYVEWALPAELEFVGGRSMDGRVEITGTTHKAQSGSFVLPVGGAIDLEIQVRALSAPPSTMTNTVAYVWRGSDKAELSRETESTTIKPNR